LFGDFTATDPDEENSNQHCNYQQPLRAPMARANENNQYQNKPEESSSSTRPDAKSDFLQDLQENLKIMDALSKIERQEDFPPNDFDPLLVYHGFLRESGVSNLAFRDFAFEVWEQMEWESDIHLCIDNTLNNHLACQDPSAMGLKSTMNVPLGAPSTVPLWQVKASQQEDLVHFDPAKPNVSLLMCVLRNRLACVPAFQAFDLAEMLRLAVGMCWVVPLRLEIVLCLFRRMVCAAFRILEGRREKAPCCIDVRIKSVLRVCS
jgi:hypothetical protein